MRPTRVLAIGLIGLVWGLPLAGGLAVFAMRASDVDAWSALLDHPQMVKALVLSLWTGTAGLVLSLGFSLLIVAGLHGSRMWPRLQGFAAAGLALPHLAFAIGFGFLIMPSGLVARLFAGGAAPPQWVTTQDPLGLSLIASLVLKEIPFFIVLTWSILVQGDVARRLEGHWRSARGLGHGTGSVWLRVLLPQILPRLTWPMVIVWVYGTTVVDMALVIGPTQPPTLASIVWADLNNASEAINARGAAGAALLTLVLAALGLLTWLCAPLARKTLHRFITSGPSRLTVPVIGVALIASATILIYAMVLAMLAVMSMAGQWPYPRLVPEGVRFDAWRHLIADGGAPGLSLVLALATSAVALGLAVLWFETMAPRFDRVLTIVAIASLGLPAVAVAGGQYFLFLGLDLTGTITGLFLAHLTYVFAYVFIVLKGPYRGFDPRLRSTAYGLNAGAVRFWRHVKLPLLKAPLAIAAAVGFAVSMVQFVPAELMAAGRHATLPMEAVTLASGGDRPLAAAYALALALFPALAFLAAQMLGRPRWTVPWS